MGINPKTVLGEHYSDSTHKLYNTLQEAYSVANDNMRTKQISSKKQYDHNLNIQKFIEGEWAFVWKPAPKGCTNRKFFDHWRGPFKIVKKVTDHSYKIDKGGNKFDVVHMELMKSAPPRENGDVYPADPSDSESEDIESVHGEHVDEPEHQSSIGDDEDHEDRGRGIVTVPHSAPQVDSAPPTTRNRGDRGSTLRQNPAQRTPYQHIP